MLQLTGTVKSAGAYKVGQGDKQKVLISMNVADEIGNVYSCQMWPDDQQHAQLAQVIDTVRYQPVRLVVKSYTSRLREMKDTNGNVTEKRPQTNFIMSNVEFPNMMNGQQAAAAGAADH